MNIGNNKECFLKLIKSIGFNETDFGYDNHTSYYIYNEFRIYIDVCFYQFSNGENWIYNDINDDFTFDYDDLIMINFVFKKELRSVKLKKILG